MLKTYMHGDKSCKISSVIESENRVNKEWMKHKEEGNRFYKNKEYDNAKDKYLDSFFIAGGFKSSYKLLSKLFQCNNDHDDSSGGSTTTSDSNSGSGSDSNGSSISATTSDSSSNGGSNGGLYRISCIPGLLHYILQYVEFNFRSNKFDDYHPLPNLGVGITCSNIAQCILNQHSIQYKTISSTSINDNDDNNIIAEYNMLMEALQWLQLSLKNLPTYTKSREREVEAYKRLSLSSFIKNDKKQLNIFKEKYKLFKDDLFNFNAITEHFKSSYMEGEAYASFFLNKITRNNFELIYSKRTFLNVLNEMKDAPRFRLQIRFSLVNLSIQNIQALSVCIDAINVHNDDTDEFSRVYENVCIHVMDSKKGTGELLERPPHGHATPTAIRNFYHHMDFVFNDVLASPEFSTIEVFLVTLGQGLTEEVDNFKKWLEKHDITGIGVRPAISTFASEEAGITGTGEFFDLL